jgi:hypothetical protein
MRRVTELTEMTPPTSTGEVAAYVLVQAESDVDLAKLVSGMHGLPGVVSATRVIGPYDVIAEASIRSEETRASLASAVAGIPGVMRVVTMPTGSSAGQTDDSSWAA